MNSIKNSCANASQVLYCKHKERRANHQMLGVLEGDESGRCLPKQALFKFIGKDVDCSAETLHHSFASL